MIELRLVHHCRFIRSTVRSNDVGSSIMRNVRSQDVTKKQKKMSNFEAKKEITSKINYSSKHSFKVVRIRKEKSQTKSCITFRSCADIEDEELSYCVPFNSSISAKAYELASKLSSISFGSKRQ